MGLYVVWVNDPTYGWFPVSVSDPINPENQWLRTENRLLIKGFQPNTTTTFAVSYYPEDIGPPVTVTTLPTVRFQQKGTEAPLCSAQYKWDYDSFYFKSKISGIVQYDVNGDGIYEYPNYGFIAGNTTWSKVYPNPRKGARFRILNASGGANCTVSIKVD
jgi:hypothetical protein